MHKQDTGYHILHSSSAGSGSDHNKVEPVFCFYFVPARGKVFIPYDQSENGIKLLYLLVLFLFTIQYCKLSN